MVYVQLGFAVFCNIAVVCSNYVQLGFAVYCSNALVCSIKLRSVGLFVLIDTIIHYLQKAHSFKYL